MKRLSISFLFLFGMLCTYAAEPFIVFTKTEAAFPVVSGGKPCPILVDGNEDKAILIAVQNLQEDLLRMSGTKAETASTPTASQYILVGSVESPYIKRLFKDGKLNKKELQGKNEKYVIQTIDQPMKGG